MRNTKHFCFLLILSLFLITACASNSSENEAYTRLEPEEGPVEIEFWHTHNDSETATLKKMLTQFEAEYPNISVKLQQVPFSDALNKYKTVAQAGHAPDLFRAEITWTTELADLGYLMSLDGFFDEAFESDFIKQAFAYVRYDNHIWGVPQVTDCLALFYNKTLVPEPPETLEDLISISKEITRPEDSQYGFFFRGDPYWFSPFIWSFGGDMVDSDTLAVKIAEQESVDALQFLIDLREKHHIVPASMDFANDYDNQQIGFKSGQYAMIMNGPWSTADILGEDQFEDHDNLGIARIPRGPGGYGSPVGGHNYVVASNTKHLLATWELVSFLSRPENQASFALENNILPTRNSTYALPEVRNNRIISDFKHVLDAATVRPVIPQSGALFVDLKPSYQAALLGDKTPQEALDEVAEAWHDLMERK